MEIKAEFTGTETEKAILTPKEWVVFLHYCEGWAKKQIADYVCRSENTIKTQETAIRQKFETHSISHAMAKAIAKGMVTLSTLCFMAAVNVGGYFAETRTEDTRRAPRTVRTQRINQQFRDFIV